MFNVTGTTNTTLTLATAQTANRTLTLPDANDVLVGRATTDTLTNKTLTNPVISAIVNGGATLTLPTTNDTLVGRATTDTLTNKTWNGNVIGIAYGGSGQTTQTAAFDALAPTTTKGDIIVHNGTDNVRVGVPATNGLLLMTNSALATGVTWMYPVLTNATVSSTVSTSVSSITPAVVNSMTYTIPAGAAGTYYVVFSTTIWGNTNSSSVFTLSIYNGTTEITSSRREYVRNSNVTVRSGIVSDAVMSCAVGDVITAKGFNSGGSNVQFNIYSRSLTLIRIG